MKWSISGPGRFTPGKESWSPLNRKLGGPHGLSGRFREEKTSCSYLNLKPGSFSPQSSHCTGFGYADFNENKKEYWCLKKYSVT